MLGLNLVSSTTISLPAAPAGPGHKHQGEAVSKQRPVPGAVLERGQVIATELYSPIFTGYKAHYCSPVLPYWPRGLLVFMINKSQIWRVFFEDDGGNPRSHL